MKKKSRSDDNDGSTRKRRYLQSSTNHPAGNLSPLRFLIDSQNQSRIKSRILRFKFFRKQKICICNHFREDGSVGNHSLALKQRLFLPPFFPVHLLVCHRVHQSRRLWILHWLLDLRVSSIHRVAHVLTPCLFASAWRLLPRSELDHRLARCPNCGKQSQAREECIATLQSTVVSTGGFVPATELQQRRRRICQRNPLFLCNTPCSGAPLLPRTCHGPFAKHSINARRSLAVAFVGGMKRSKHATLCFKSLEDGVELGDRANKTLMQRPNARSPCVQTKCKR